MSTYLALRTAQVRLLDQAIAAMLDRGVDSSRLAIEVACGVETHDEWLTVDGRRVYRTWINTAARSPLVSGEWL